MLHREDPEGLIVITQPVHAWIAAQLARNWGNTQFGTFAPWEEVCLGAEQHDVGMAAWERAPTLNPESGRPYHFRNMPTREHVRCWAEAARLALVQGRYPALLTSLHGTGLYERFHDWTRDTPEEAQAARDYLKAEHAFQEWLLGTLRNDPVYAPYATEEAVTRNRRLVSAWDRLSLALCHGVHAPAVIGGVPTATGETTLTLAPVQDDPLNVTLDPWPFHAYTVRLVYEGHRLPQTFTDEAAMRAALAAAPWITIVTVLRKIEELAFKQRRTRRK
ncbi:MAG: DUF3891 family protein [Thermomicrobia bacterium]|nr:DUF3891 family protein [Thermomicrobia bacterium]